MKLAERQALFFAAARGLVERDVLDAAFVGRGALTGADRMCIYNHAYFARLEAALADTFPICRALLGPERFVQLARRYVMITRTHEPEIERMGLGFPAFVAARHADMTIAEAARLEWARVRALLAPDSPCLRTLPALAAHELAHLTLCWVPSLSLCTVRSAAFRTFHEARAQAAAPGSEVLTVALWRRGHHVEYRTLEAREARLLARAPSPTLFEVCSEFASTADGVDGALMLLRRWFSAGWVAALEQSEVLGGS
jgi:hypothetical protein